MDRIKLLNERKSEIEKSSRKIRDFINSIVDTKSFVETNAFEFSSNDTIAECISSGEGVITGYATTNGMPIYLYAQNFEVLKGGFGKEQADKIVKTMDAALKTGTPVVSILDSAGARLGEGIEALEGYSKVLAKSIELSGVIPQIAIVKGQALGMISYLSSINDLCFMVEKSVMGTTSPLIIEAKSNTMLTAEKICGVPAHEEKTGICSLSLKEKDVKKALADVLDFVLVSGDVETKQNGVSAELNDKSDVDTKFKNIFDNGEFVEFNKKYESSLRTAIGRIGGVSVGIVAGNGDNITGKAARKAARFVRFLECFSLPLVSLVDSKGLEISVNNEHSGITKDISTLMYAINETVNAKIAVIVGSAVGVAYTALASKNMGFDTTFAWANSVVSALQAETGAELVYADEINKAKNKDKARLEVASKYAEIEGDPYFAAQKGYIDNIIEPAQTRLYIISALQILKYKNDDVKGSGNIPL